MDTGQPIGLSIPICQRQQTNLRCSRLKPTPTFTRNLISLVTPFPPFRLPSSAGLSEIFNSFSISPSLTPTFPATFANFPYVSFLVSPTTFTSKNSVCTSNNSALKGQNLSGASRSTAAPASWQSVLDGCHGWICCRNIRRKDGWRSGREGRIEL